MPYADPAKRRANDAKPERRYQQHRQNVRSQGIPFLLSFKQWWEIWQQSGKWKQRGFKRGQYYMTRLDDRGAFEIGNIVIVLMTVDAAKAEAAQRRYRELHRFDPEYKYRSHRQNALARDIPFRLTFAQWWRIWQRSGKWEQRGTDSDQYCMARPGDRGAYEIGNVVIVLNYENRTERNQNYPMKGEDNPAFEKDYWAIATKAERQRRGDAISKKLKGRRKSAETRERMRQAALRRKNRTYPNG